MVLNCSISVNLRPFKGSPRSRASRGPLAHTLIRRNRSFSEVKNLATSLLIISQKEKILSSLEKIRHALRTCGSAATALYSILSTELRFVFHDIQVVFA